MAILSREVLKLSFILIYNNDGYIRMTYKTTVKNRDFVDHFDLEMKGLFDCILKLGE